MTAITPTECSAKYHKGKAKASYHVMAGNVGYGICDDVNKYYRRLVVNTAFYDYFLWRDKERWKELKNDGEEK